MKPEEDDYPTCWETYATLRCYHPEEAASAVSGALGIEPDRTLKAGAPLDQEKPERLAKRHAWFLYSEERVASYDAEKHLAWLLDQLVGREEGVRALLHRGWFIDVVCLWDSACGHGGPTLSPQTMGRIANLGIPLWFDVYFRGADILSGEDSPKNKKPNQTPQTTTGSSAPDRV